MYKILFILMITGVSLLIGGCKEGTILSSLNQRQSNEVLAALHKHQIQAVKVPQGKGLFTISVPEEQSRQAIHILQEYHLPSNERIEIAGIFPSDSLIASPQSEKARLISAIEQRLEQSLLSFDAVTGARVHLSYPLSGPGSPRKKPETPRASVLIYHSGIEDETQFTLDIQTFVMNAFNGLTEDTVSVLLYPGKPVIDLPPQPEEAGLSPLFLLFPAGIMLAAAGYFCRAQLRVFLMRRKVKQHE
ncbi:type III secretion inner membrane ring lipoprotein SctJ [Morganella morganii]|nr:type III secretion inner membrane ring lipoprotein SctJ [Morganella morganii]